MWASEVDHDPFLLLLAAGLATGRVQVGHRDRGRLRPLPDDAGAPPRYDLQRYTRGRFVLGLGTQVKAHVERRFSMPWSPPAARMREYVGGAAGDLGVLAGRHPAAVPRASTTSTP